MLNSVCGWISGSVAVDALVVDTGRWKISLAVIGVKYDDPAVAIDGD